MWSVWQSRVSLFVGFDGIAVGGSLVALHKWQLRSKGISALRVPPCFTMLTADIPEKQFGKGARRFSRRWNAETGKTWQKLEVEKAKEHPHWAAAMAREAKYSAAKHAAPVHHKKAVAFSSRAFPSSIPADLFSKFKSASGVMLADGDSVRAMRIDQVLI